MKGISIINLFICYCTLITWNLNKPLYASATILNCNGDIPKKTACIIKASTFNFRIRRIDICQKNPFPNYRNNADFNASKCINLLNKNVSGLNYLDGEEKYYITKDLNIEKGIYRYISIIIENKFIVSGKYKANNYFWGTSKEGPKKIIQSKNNISFPEEYTTKLTNWRGENNLENKYCENNGGTSTRCDLQYNGLRMSGVGLDSNFMEVSGKKTKFMFFVSDLSPAVNLNQDSEGYFNIDLERNLEVFGKGSFVTSISIAPFQLKTKFTNQNQK